MFVCIVHIECSITSHALQFPYYITGTFFIFNQHQLLATHHLHISMVLFYICFFCYRYSVVFYIFLFFIRQFFKFIPVNHWIVLWKFSFDCIQLSLRQALLSLSFQTIDCTCSNLKHSVRFNSVRNYFDYIHLNCLT